MWRKNRRVNNAPAGCPAGDASENIYIYQSLAVTPEDSVDADRLYKLDVMYNGSKIQVESGSFLVSMFGVVDAISYTEDGGVYLLDTDGVNIFNAFASDGTEVQAYASVAADELVLTLSYSNSGSGDNLNIIMIFVCGD